MVTGPRVQRKSPPSSVNLWLYENLSIPDNIDECILSQEIFNGFEDTDGCPDNISSEIIFILDDLIFSTSINFVMFLM